MAVVYQHLTDRDRIPFYIGISHNMKRPYIFTNRSLLWKNISSKYGCIVDIICNNMSIESAIEIEKHLIKSYGNWSNICQVCKGNRLTAGGYHWRYE